MLYAAICLAALEALRAAGCRQFFWKYCSTFDSTPKGNIGPVAEALLQALGGDRAVVCPSFPENKRTVYQGYLFVGDRLLHETSMRSHPLTPMTDANLIRLMDAQSSRKSGLVPLDVFRRRIHGQDGIEVLMVELFYHILDMMEVDDHPIFIQFFPAPIHNRHTCYRKTI